MNYLITVINALSRYLISGIAIHLTFSIGGIFFLGFPTIINISGYALAISQKEGFTHFPALLIALLAGLITSIGFAYLYTRVSQDSFAVIGLASLFAIESLTTSWDNLTNGVLGIAGITRPDLFQTLANLTLLIAIIGISLLIMEWIFLQTPSGRILQAQKEKPISVESIGCSTKKLTKNILIIAGILFSLSGVFIVWYVQFITPSFFGINGLIEILTIGIIALRPKIRYLLLGILFIILVPEIIRFLKLPSTIFGHLRILLYCISIIILIRSLKNKLYIAKRSI